MPARLNPFIISIHVIHDISPSSKYLMYLDSKKEALANQKLSSPVLPGATKSKIAVAISSPESPFHPLPSKRFNRSMSGISRQRDVSRVNPAGITVDDSSTSLFSKKFIGMPQPTASRLERFAHDLTTEAFAGYGGKDRGVITRDLDDFRAAG